MQNKEMIIKGKDLIIKLKNELYKRKAFIICLLITMLFFGGFCRLDFSRCTFRMYIYDYMIEYNHFLKIGRYLVAFFWLVVNKIGLSLRLTHFISYTIGILSISTSIFIFYNILNKHSKNKIFNIIISTATILNIYCLDYFMYLERGILAFSILTCIIACKKIIDYFESSKKRNILYSFIFLLISAISYQASVALYITIVTIFIIKYSKGIKGFIKNNILAVMNYGASLGIVFLLMKLGDNSSTSRTKGDVNLAESIKNVFSGLKNIFIKSYGIIPKNLFAICLITIIVISIITIVVTKEKEQRISRKIVLLLGLIYCLLGCTITAILPQLAIDTVAISITPRAVYSFASIIAVPIIYVVVNINSDLKLAKIFMGFIVLTYITIQCYEFNAIIEDHYTLNYMEKQYAYMIGEEIEEYENKNNIKIKEIIFYTDKNSSHNPKDLKSYGEINERVFRTTWSRVDILNYYLERNFKQNRNQNEDYKKEFEKTDFNKFDKKQFIFDGETLHLCIY